MAALRRRQGERVQLNGAGRASTGVSIHGEPDEHECWSGRGVDASGAGVAWFVHHVGGSVREVQPVAAGIERGEGGDPRLHPGRRASAGRHPADRGRGEEGAEPVAGGVSREEQQGSCRGDHGERERFDRAVAGAVAGGIIEGEQRAFAEAGAVARRSDQ